MMRNCETVHSIQVFFYTNTAYIKPLNPKLHQAKLNDEFEKEKKNQSKYEEEEESFTEVRWEANVRMVRSRSSQVVTFVSLQSQFKRHKLM